MRNTILLLILLLIANGKLFCQVNFSDDFQADLGHWEFADSNLVKIIQSNDPIHKSVLRLTPNNTAECILIKDSESWDSISVEGEVLFPDNQHNYFGFVYNYQNTDRKDFGCIYLKGNDSYIRVNPHRDGNASRTLYEEYKTELSDNLKIEPNVWIPFKAELIGAECHFYIIDLDHPAVIFKNYEYSTGKIGFKPRFAGGECWIDNVMVSSINAFGTNDDNMDSKISYSRDSLISEWDVMGPFNQRMHHIEESVQNNSVDFEGNRYAWTEFMADERGCVLAGLVCRFTDENKYAYFTTVIEEEKEISRVLEFSTRNNLHVWVNSGYAGEIARHKYAWFDFVTNPQHSGSGIPVKLRKGSNRILILVEGGNYGGDGFYAHLRSNIAELNKSSYPPTSFVQNCFQFLLSSPPPDL